MNKQVEANQAIRDWVACRDEQGRMWNLQISTCATRGIPDLDTALMYWRAQLVQSVLANRGRTKYQRLILEDLLWHYQGESRPLETFRGAPRGSDAKNVLVGEINAIMDLVETAIGKGEGRPANLTVEAA